MPDAVKSITVQLVASLTVGAQAQAAADVVTTVPDNTLNQQALAWSSSNPAVATVNATTTGCTVTAIAPGNCEIRATIGTVTGQAPLTVTAPVVDITAAQETAIRAVPVGGVLTLRGPTTDFSVQVSG